MKNTASSWHQGWWQLARQCPSPNFGPRPTNAVIDLAVIHSISLPPGCYGGPEIEHLFTNRLDWHAHPYFQTLVGLEVSSHFVIRRTGQTDQYVSVLDRAWHAGASHWRGRGNCNDDSVGIELEGLEGDTFELAQYTALVQLLRSLCRCLPIVYVAGHEHIAPGRKHDPGTGFDWARVQSSVADLSLTWP